MGLRPGRGQRIRGGFWGLAVGDALGVPVEFVRRPYLDENPVTGMRENGTHHQVAGTWSDDTSMTLATADAVILGDDATATMRRYWSWYARGTYTPFGTCFDIGSTTRGALERFQLGGLATSCGGTTEQHNGNGALMRMLPIALAATTRGDGAVAQACFDHSGLTHGHVRSRLCCAWYGVVAAHLVAGEDLAQARHAATTATAHLMVPSEWPHLRHILEGTVLTRPREEIRSGGYAVDTLGAAIWCLHHHRGFREAILAAVNLGDDTDTTAAVTGSLAGLCVGINGVPSAWRMALQAHHQIDSIVERFIAHLRISH